MYRVVIIDDEEYILNGLKNMIKWEEFNCSVCAIATNAEEGVKIICDVHPDSKESDTLGVSLFSFCRHINHSPWKTLKR